MRWWNSFSLFPTINQEEDDKDSEEKIKTDPNEYRTCAICLKMFYDKYAMKRHVKTQHKLKNRFKCDQCDKPFASGFAMKYHVKKYHSETCWFERLLELFEGTTQVCQKDWKVEEET